MRQRHLILPGPPRPPDVRRAGRGTPRTVPAVPLPVPLQPPPGVGVDAHEGKVAVDERDRAFLGQCREHRRCHGAGWALEVAVDDQLHRSFAEPRPVDVSHVGASTGAPLVMAGRTSNETSAMARSVPVAAANRRRSCRDRSDSAALRRRASRSALPCQTAVGRRVAMRRRFPRSVVRSRRWRAGTSCIAHRSRTPR